VLLSVRDGDAWARSMKDTIWGALYGDTMLRDLSSARVRIDPGWRGYIELMTEMWQRTGLLTTMEAATEPGALAQVMERYNEEVIRTVPVGSAARVVTRRRLGAAVRVPGGVCAAGPVPARQRYRDVHRLDCRGMYSGAD